MELVLTDETLMAIAQIALALIGFSGVVVTLGKGDGRWSDVELLQLKTLVEPSLVVLAAAFIPYGLTLMNFSGDVLWRVSNGALMLLHAIGNSLFIARGIKNSSSVVTGQLVTQTICLFIYALLIGSVFNLFSYHQLAFLLGLLIGILVSVHNFYLLIFRKEGST